MSLHRFCCGLLSAVLFGLGSLLGAAPSRAAEISAPAGGCRLSAEAVARKAAWQRAALAGNGEAGRRYLAQIGEDAAQLRLCRAAVWPRVQAIWLRLYPCDLQPGAIDALMDRLVALGYNRIHLEVFFEGQVLLPMADNPTVWPSVVRVPPSADLLASAIASARARGVAVYAWLFSLNFGYSYTQLADRQVALACNGLGRTSLTAVGEIDSQTDMSILELDRVFVDPYSRVAREDFARLVEAVLRRKPDGILFDYVRYPRSSGAASVATGVRDLWVFGEASRQTLLSRTLNLWGGFLIERYLERGWLSESDLAEADRQFPLRTGAPWSGYSPPARPLSPAGRRPYLQRQLWSLGLSHAREGIVQYLAEAALPAHLQGVATGAVFFAEADRAVGAGFDSRLQPWPQFLSVGEWHPMVYANCGEAHCILSQVQTVLERTPPGIAVVPSLAGVWGRAHTGRPALEVQMAALQAAFPSLQAVSHFAYAWQEPQLERERRTCSGH
ncbi:hypothetical protein [Gloeobacter morelensis]|uniref:Glycosyl hydrolase-like 10 domain-containing protein n=1 Tax=Gloeobacter morelensis MG652769 TaxID=2781736 RepID=A0ABY3PRW9_9CYAN|nr:hypothetical protein [Gloeobacter morelensis]UFP96357.1 hypothetical protein ISF26_09160 [Gloeobacter morelensis MG652769]